MMMPPAVLIFGIDTFDHDTVVERTEFHALLLGFCDFLASQSQCASASRSSHKVATLGRKGFGHAFWETKLEGPLFAVTVAHSKLIKPAELRALDGVFRLH
jgi:hypothetical protein